MSDFPTAKFVHKVHAPEFVNNLFFDAGNNSI
jgi:hypothetical protein